MIRSVIIDDEPHGVQALRQLILENCPDVEVAGSAGNTSDGIALVRNLQPQLIFLDIELSSGSGFEILKAFNGERSFEVIFTTAYEQYAVRAIRESALDYLLKPIDTDELVQAVNKARARLKPDQPQSDRHSLEQLLDKLSRIADSARQRRFAIPSQEAIVYVDEAEIVRLEASSNYTEIFLEGGKKYIVSKTLKELEEQLSGSSFFRTHKAHLVNLTFVSRFIKQDGGYLIMKDGIQIPVARPRREELLKALAGG